MDQISQSQYLGAPAYGNRVTPSSIPSGMQVQGISESNLQIQFKNVELIRIINDLKKKENQVQQEAAKKLHQYMSQYQEDCDDNLFNQFKQMLESKVIEEKFGALMAINKIARIGRETRIIHNVKKIMTSVENQLKINNKELVEKAADCLGILAEAGGKTTAEVFDSVLDKMIEMLQKEKDNKSNNIEKYSAVLVIKEFCKKLQIITFNKLFDKPLNDSMKSGFNSIFDALKDHRLHVRTTAADCINECIRMISLRDYSNDQKRKYLDLIYNEVSMALFDTHNADANYQQSTLSILSELIQVKGGGQGMNKNNKNIIMQNEQEIISKILKLIDESKAIQVKKQCVELLPQLIKHLPEFQTNNKKFEQAIKSIFNFINKKDKKAETAGENLKGVGFNSLGKISLLVSKSQMEPYLPMIFDLIDAELNKRPTTIVREQYNKSLQLTDLLVCIRDISRRYGNEIEKRYGGPGSVSLQNVQRMPGGGHKGMYEFIANLFFFGFKKQLVDAMKEMTKICSGQYKMGIQTKMLNTINIILTHNRNYFPVVQLINNYRKNQIQRKKEQKKQSVQQQKKESTMPGQVKRESPGFSNIMDDSMAFGKSQQPQDQSIVNDSVLGDSIMMSTIEESKASSHRGTVKDFDPQQMFDPKFIETKKIENLQTLLDNNSQIFLLNLCLGVKDPKQIKKLAKGELEKIKEEGDQMIILALKSLNSFSFDEVESNFNILQFMSESVLPYLFNENPQIRNEAVLTFSSLKFQDKQKLYQHQEIQVNKLLHKFFVTATTDADINIRQSMLMSLNSDFDPFISKYENLLMLFNCMKDSNNEIKIKTIKILGRLTPHNPQQILPYLRNLIVSLISQLEHSHQYKEREEAAKLIKYFVKYNKDLSKSYAQSILNCLFQRIDQDKKQKITTPFISALLDVMREISFVDSDATKPYIGEIFPLILESVKDQSDFQKREVALNTLIAMIDNTGFVVKPYFFYPELLTIIRNLVQSEQVQSVRKLVFKLIGTLGAVDPYLMNQINEYHKQKNNNEDSEMLENLPQMLGIEPHMIKSNDEDQESIEQNQAGANSFDSIYFNRNNFGDGRKNMHGLDSIGFLNFGQANQMLKEIPIVLDISRVKNQDYVAGAGFFISLEAKLAQYGIKKSEITKENKFSLIAIEQLMKILNDSTLIDHHTTILRGINYIVQKIGKDCTQFLPMIVPSILNGISLEDESNMQNLQEFHSCLKQIIDCVPQCIIEYQNMIFDTVEQVLTSQPIQESYIITLVRHINLKSTESYLPQMNFILPKVLQIIESKRYNSDFMRMGTSSSSNQKAQTIIKSQMENFKICKEAFVMIQELKRITKDDNLHLIIPLLVRVISRSNNNESKEEIEFKIEIVKTINSLVFCKSFREYIATIVHTMINVIEVYQSKETFTLHSTIIDLFCRIAKVLNIDFAPFIPLILEQFKRNKRISLEFNLQIEDITRINLVDLFKKNLENDGNEFIDDYSGEEVAGGSTSFGRGQQQMFGRNQVQKSMANEIEIRRYLIDMEVLMKDFDTDKISIEADWNEWLKKTSFQLLKQSPSPILFACSSVAEVYSPIASELYNVAFLTLWNHLNDHQKDHIMRSIKKSTQSIVQPRGVLQTILNLHEFMELDENKQKVFDERTLAEIAEQCNAYAKALYYWEMEFQNDAKSTIEKIITTNYGLGQPEAAKGILISAKRNQLIEKDESYKYETMEWLEKRHEWKQALKKYSDRLQEQPENLVYKKGKLRCLKNLYDWDNLSKMVGQMWDKELTVLEQKKQNGLSEPSENLFQIANDGLESSFNLGEWTNFSKYIKVLQKSNTPNSFQKSFYHAIIDIKNHQYQNAYKHIERAREILDPKITSLLGESYSRAYSLIQDLQSLKELEEVILYVRTNDEQRKSHIYSLWQKRFAVFPSEDLSAFQRSLNLRSIVIDKVEEVDQFINFANIAQNSGNKSLGSRILNKLQLDLIEKKNLLQQDSNKANKIQDELAKVKLSIFENDYNMNKQEHAISMLDKMITNGEIKDPQQLSDCYLKLSKWNFDFKDQQIKTGVNLTTSQNQHQHVIGGSQLTGEDFDKTIRYCKRATEVGNTNKEAWHYFSQINYEASKFYSICFAESLQQQAQEEFRAQQLKDKNMKQKILIPEDYGEKIVQMTMNLSSKLNQKQRSLGTKYILHIVNAIRGLVQQLYLSDQEQSIDSSKTLQNTLRLMKIWFRHGGYEQIDDIVRDGIDKINLKVWINVIPQLIARIDIKENKIKQLLIDLLERLSQKYPQALIYSLSVSKKSRTNERRESAEAMLNKLKVTQGTLIEQANMVSDELIRAAILLSEIWTEAIEDASRVYFGKYDGEAMINNLKELHKRMEEPPETMNEINFYQGFASDLEEAQLWTNVFQQTKNQSDMNQAWDIYFNVFKRIQSKYQNVQFYELRNVAPKLLASENLQIAVPGTFRCGRRVTKIAKFSQVLPVFSSKQHPRKLSLMGDDGREYVFLLKGHEDTRQDERVMQLFGLVNTLLSTDAKTCKKDLAIRRYPVIPLSHDAGLIGMVPNVDTLNQLIRDHRQLSNIIFNTETKTMEQMFESYENCPLLNKVEIFRYAQNHTLGEDLQRVLWLKSQNSELWLERRTNYTRSLAVMSMVGYILGLGDRHPSNILLDRFSGKIIHIDFGDCFESAMRREKYPEKIPFRLTRMLQKAMEVSGIEGNFRTICENTMRVMRANKDSLLAILEAFVYDPLLSFRLLNLKALMKQNADKDIFVAPEVGVGTSVKNGQNAVEMFDNMKQKVSNDIRQSIVAATIEKYRHIGDKSDIVVRTYAQKELEKKNEGQDLMQILENKKEEELIKKELNQAAEVVVQRINDKLRGTEFPIRQKLNVRGGSSINQTVEAQKEQIASNKKDIEEQVDLLIQQATNHENLAQCYPGWCPYW